MRRTSLLAIAVLLPAIVVAPRGSPHAIAQATRVLVYFVADDGVHGRELWASDGTEDGTVMVRDIRPGEPGSDPQLYAVIRGRVLFVADDGEHGPEMWVSDGTEAGTSRLLAAPAPCGYYGGVPSFCWGDAVSRGTLYFSADEDLMLWGTDGTNAGTFPVGVEGSSLASGGPIVFFVHLDSEVWRTDGTRRGTFMLQRVRRHESATVLSIGFVDIGRRSVYGSRDVKHGWEPWRTDGTVPGTALLKDIVPGHDSSYTTMLGGTRDLAFFKISQPGGLWASDGSTAGTVELRRFHKWIGSLGGAPILDGAFYFYTYAGGFGAELWKSDGTRGGTVMVKDINPGRPGSYPRGAAVLDDALFFGADDGVHGHELWASDGTEAGTFMVKEINPGVATAFPDHLVSSGGLLLFGANDGVHGYELWRSDGTEAGTFMVKDINPGAYETNDAITYMCASPSSDHCSYLL